MPIKISSSANEKIKGVLRLRRKPTIDSSIMLIDGCREIQRALDARVMVKTVFYCPDFLTDSKLFQSLEKEAEEVYETTAEVFEKIAFGDRQEGIVMIGQANHLKLEDLDVSHQACFLVVDNVEKPGNLGAILRTADGAGVKAVLFCDQLTSVYNSNVIRASVGTVFSVPVVQCSSVSAAEFLRLHQFKIGAAIPDADVIYYDCDFSGRVALVVGREDLGVSDFWKSRADIQYKIPMRGQGDSLNVSCATAVIVYEILKQKSC